MHLVRAPLLSFDTALPEFGIHVDRQKLAKRLWRAAADDGTPFGFELEAPLRHGDTVWASSEARYVIRQEPELVLEIPLDPKPEVAAMIGWAVGNLHFDIETQTARLLAPNDPALRRALDRFDISYNEVVEIFRPRRFPGSLIGPEHHHG
ncbi:MAG: urease accessory protein UreE [Opitutaceae bacterium]|jgi:urease accessory protein